MPRIYCEIASGDILTEAEALQAVTDIIEQNPQYAIDELENYTAVGLWRMLTDKAKAEVIRDAVERKLENDYGWRDFTDKELE